MENIRNLVIGVLVIFTVIYVTTVIPQKSNGRTVIASVISSEGR